MFARVFYYWLYLAGYQSQLYPLSYGYCFPIVILAKARTVELSWEYLERQVCLNP
jgi:hypothetical protein